MIQLLKDYFDKTGRKYKVLQYVGGKYLCESYSGKQMYFSSGELYTKSPSERNAIELPKSGGIETDLEYVFEGISENKEDNSKETNGEKDFYSDFV